MKGSLFQRWLLDEATLGVPVRVPLSLMELTCTPKGNPRAAMCRRLSAPQDLRGHIYSSLQLGQLKHVEIR